MELKEPGVCRIFFSSPFRGLEIEREELTKKYWPQIRSFCNARGLQFVPVDMRWGITSELSDSAQTIKICLREIDRSDMFIGFFGQRYGWHGAADSALQENFDEALSTFPWLEQYRDRSVTELEFLHGHLNKPGNLPAYICFRDKGYDDEQRQKAENEGNKRRIAAFSSESEHATAMMDDLKSRIKATEEKCLGIDLAYKDPVSCAEEMFKMIMQHLRKYLTKQRSVELSWRETELTHHDSYSATRRNIYFGGEQYIKRLDEHINSDSSKPLVVVADNGYGKSALLSTWISRRQQMASNDVIIYVFIGASEKSSNPENILRFVVEQLNFCSGHPAGKELQNGKSISDLLQELQVAMTNFKSIGKKAIVVLDGVNKVEENTKTHLPLHWLPTTFPTGVHVVVSTVASHKRSFNELSDVRGSPTLDVLPIDPEIRNQMCIELLKLRGKEFSQAQLDRVVTAQMAQSPLFLKVLLEELCAFGNFRKLDSKINSLRNSESVEELFGKVLERLEQDYNMKESESNIIEQVLCALTMSRKGLTEEDIVNMFSIPSMVWSPLIYALEPFLIKRSGLLGIMYDEMKTAVQKRYMDSETKRNEYIGRIVQHMYQEMLIKIAAEEFVPPYWIETLPWLCRKAELKAKLLKLLTTVEVFEYLFGYYAHELLEYWTFLGAKGQEIETLYVKYAINKKTADNYIKDLDSYNQPNPIRKCLLSLEKLAQFLGRQAGYYSNALNIYRKMESLVEENKKLSSEKKHWWNTVISDGLAATYGLLHDFKNSLKYHLKRAELLESEGILTDELKSELSVSYHGAGSAYVYVGDLEKAKEYMNKSIQINEELNPPDKDLKNSDTYQNLAQAYAAAEQHDKALELLEKGLELKEKYFFGQQHLDISYALTNLGIGYRKVNRFDDANRVYQRALEIKKQLLGWNHPDVAIAIGNLSNLARNMGNYSEAEDYAIQSLNIYKEVGGADFPMAKNIQENIALLLILQNRTEEAEKHFWEVYEWRRAHDDLNRSLPGVVGAILQHFKDTQQWDKLTQLLPVFIGTSLSEPSMAILLRAIDVEVKGGKGPDRPFEVSIERQIELFPTRFDVIQAKFGIDLIRLRDIEKMKEYLKNYSEVSEKGTELEMKFIGVQEQCDANQWAEGGVEILQFGHQLFPKSEVILRNLCSYHTEKKMYDLAVDYWNKLLAVNDEVPAFHLGLVHCLAMQGKIEEGRECLKTARTKWADNSDVLAAIQEKSSILDQIEKLIQEHNEKENGSS